MFLTRFWRVGFFPAELQRCQRCCIPDMEVRHQTPNSTSALNLQPKYLIDVSLEFGIKLVFKICLWYDNDLIWCLVLKEYNQACQFILQWKNRDYLGLKTVEIKLWLICWCFHDFWPEHPVTPHKKCQGKITALIKCCCFTFRENIFYFFFNFKKTEKVEEIARSRLWF